MSITNLPNEIVLELSKYLPLIDKISLLKTNSYIYQKKNEFFKKYIKFL